MAVGTPMLNLLHVQQLLGSTPTSELLVSVSQMHVFVNGSVITMLPFLLLKNTVKMNYPGKVTAEKLKRNLINKCGNAES